MSEDPGWGGLWRGGLFPQFALLILGVWLNAADSLVTVTVMPSVARQMGGYAYFGWATAVFLLGAITAGASAGAAALRFGLRWAMVGAGLAYALGCGMGALAQVIPVFLAARLVQGVGAGWIIGLTFVAVGAVFPERLWARVFAAITGVWGVATLVGPLVGGLFANAGFWQGAFWVFCLQGGLFSLAAGWLLPKKAPEAAERPLPWPQLLLVAAGVLAIAGAGLIKIPIIGAALILLGLGLLALMLNLDAGSEAPMMPRQTRSLSSAAGAGYLTVFLLQAGTIGWTVYGAALVQVLYGASPLVSGYVVTAEALGWTLAAFPVAGLAERWHGFFIRLGVAVVLLGLAGLAIATGRLELIWVALSSVLMGCGFGLTWSFLNRQILASLPENERSLGSSALPTVQMIGSAAGAAGAGALGDVLGLAEGISRPAALLAAPVLFAGFLPLVVAAWIAAHRLAGLARTSEPEERPSLS